MMIGWDDIEAEILSFLQSFMNDGGLLSAAFAVSSIVCCVVCWCYVMIQLQNEIKYKFQRISYSNLENYEIQNNKNWKKIH